MITEKEIKKDISFWGATGIGLGAIVGGGILALAGVAFSISGPSAIIAFELNGIIAFITALSFAEMSTAFPESGGSYTFTKKVLSVRSAFAVGWILWFASIMAGALYALGFAHYGISVLQTLFGYANKTPPEWFYGKLMITALAIGAILFYTYRLTKKAGGGNQWETIGKVILFCILILGGLFALSKQSANEIQTKLTPFWGGGIFGVLQTMGYTFITFQGFDLIPAVAGEVRNPKRNIPLAIFLSLGSALLIYIPFLFILSTAGVTKGQSIISLSRSNPETVVAIAASNYLGSMGYWLVSVAAILSMLSALYANILAASRIASKMSNDRTLPRFIGVVNKDSGIPVRAVYLSSAILILSISIMPNLLAAGAAASLVFLISFTLTHVTTILARIRSGATIHKIRKKRPQSSAFPIIPLLGALSCGSLAIFQSISVPAAGKIMIIWLALGFIIYFSIFSSRAQIVDAMAEAIDPLLIRLRGRSPLVLIPLANPSNARAMVEVASALSAPDVGKALLLSVVAGHVEWMPGNSPPQLVSSQNVQKEALIASYTSNLSPEALITVAPHPWPEIIRVAHLHRCEILLLGLGDPAIDQIDPEIEKLISSIDSDIVLLKAPMNWQLSNSGRILVPVGGKSDHDELRARLLSSLCRSMEREVTFLNIVPTKITDKEFMGIRYKISCLAEDELPIKSKIEIIRNDNIIEGVREYASQSDLVILGIKRLGHKIKVFGDIALKITQTVQCATILISSKG